MNNSNEYKICAVVVTYNRIQLLKECIETLRNQTRKLDCILVVNNNSYDGTKEWLDLQIDLKVLHQENLGGAGGFHNGIKKAYELGYDWIWCMDDDAYTKETTLSILLNFVGNEYSAICPLVIDENNKPMLEHRGFYYNKIFKPINLIVAIDPLDYLKKDLLQIELTSFVGPLINSNAIKVIGYPIQKYFIHYDDIEYSLRMLQYGPIALIPGSVIVHNSEIAKDKVEIKLPFKKLYRMSYKNFWIKFFTIRNYILTRKKYGKNKSTIYLSIHLIVIKEIILILLFDNFKFKRAAIILLALYDGITNNLQRDYNSIKKDFNQHDTKITT